MLGKTSFVLVRGTSPSFRQESSQDYLILTKSNITRTASRAPVRGEKISIGAGSTACSRKGQIEDCGIEQHESGIAGECAPPAAGGTRLGHRDAGPGQSGVVAVPAASVLPIRGGNGFRDHRED